MINSRKSFLIISLLLIISILFFTKQSLSKVKDSPHDLSINSLSDSPFSGSYDTDEICVFCHTPHAGQGTVPLWNRNLSAGPFNMYTSPTYDMGPGVLGSPSTLCLSCHDGSSAMNVVYNTPGPGSSYTIDPGGAYTKIGDVWYPGSPFTGGAFKNIGGNYGVVTANNLTDDHPISFTYNPAADNATDNNGFPAIISVGSRNFIDGTLTDYPLYGASNDKFECSTCHSVHDTVTYSGKDTNEQVYFLRTSNAGSNLCKDCHTLR